jgi:hypothetical protein
MPLNTQIIRNGEPLKLHWGDFHIAAMALASSFEVKKGPLGDPTKIYVDELHVHPYIGFPISRGIAFILSDYGALGNTPLNDGDYTLKLTHRFTDLVDGEVLDLLPGDKLIAYRSW